ncbi:MAG TPA: group III truncated hemoglobin [Verrucomicrobiae bacterium]|nr:group III truncated hemoglobin [Verrucomicrobiae bacterium]
MSEEQTLYARLGGHEGILKLITGFYADVRQDAVIGPIFNTHIPDWPAHLEKIADFWALQAGGPSRYRGGFGAAHLPLNLKPEHFEHWLRLWEFNNARSLPPWEAEQMNQLAHAFARRLFGLTQRQPFAS